MPETDNKLSATRFSVFTSRPESAGFYTNRLLFALQDFSYILPVFSFKMVEIHCFQVICH